jgi:hypothetical protein
VHGVDFKVAIYRILDELFPISSSALIFLNNEQRWVT